MQLTEIIQIISSFVIGGGITAVFNANSQRKKAKFDLSHELAEECADKSRKIRQLNDEIIKLLHEKHDLEMELISTRCDKTGCKWRRPPLPWMQDVSADTNGDGLPDTDPQPQFVEAVRGK